MKLKDQKPSGFTITYIPGDAKRYRPCTKCGRSPHDHNPHPLNSDYVMAIYVGHEYK